MDKKTTEFLKGTVTKISVSYERKVSDGNYGSVGGTFYVEADLAPDADPDASMDALYEWNKAAAVRNLRASLEAVTPKAPSVPQEHPGAPQGDLAPKQAPAPVSAPPEATDGTERVMDISSQDTVQLKVTDKQQKLLLFKVKPFDKFGIRCWEEVADTWSELAGWQNWQVAQPYFVNSFNINQVVVAMKGKNPDKVVAFR